MKLINKNSLCILLLATLNVNATNLDTLDISGRVKQQLIDGVELNQSIKQFEQVRSGGAFVTVGNGVTCDYRLGSNKIQNAIDDGATEIRISSNDSYLENITINNISIIIRGGFADCLAADNNQQSGKTTISGIPAIGLPVIKILGSSQRNTVILDSLTLQQGSGLGNFPGGGISTKDADLSLQLDNVLLKNNESELGGGLAVIGGNTDIVAKDSTFLQNIAKNGGGFYCDSAQASLMMHGISAVHGNSTNAASQGIGYGGGVYLTNGCSYLMYSGVDVPVLFVYHGISDNSTGIDGGGLYVKSGSMATLYGHEFCILDECFGNDDEPVNLTFNQSSALNGDGSGAGAAVFGDGSVLNIYAGKVTDNFVRQVASAGPGGAISVEGGALFDTKRLTKKCWSQTTCNYYANNKAGISIGRGGMIYNSDSIVNVSNTVIEGNRADSGTVVFSTGVDSVVTIKGSIIHHNGNNGLDNFDDKYVFSAGGEFNVRHSTIVDNNAEIAVLNFVGSSSLSSSIVLDPSTGPVYAANQGSVTTDCSILHEIASVPSSFFTIVDDPEFVDRANGDYHLNSLLSPAIDYCFANNSDHQDMDFEPRGWDDPLVPNNNGAYDIGADESYENDIIFRNGFESLN